MKKSLKTFLIIFGAILVTLILVVVISKTSKKSLENPNKNGRPQNVATVKTEKVKIQTLEDYILTNGEVESLSSVAVFPSMSGKVVQVNVNLGSQVKKGEIIAKIDPSEPGTQYALSPVESPISGSILTIPLKVGTHVTTNSEITKVGDIENLQVTCQIPERYVSELKTGLKAQIFLQSYDDVVFDAIVQTVSPVVDKSSRTKEIILNFTKKDSRINAGMFAKVKLFTSKYSGKIVVPIDSIVTDDENSYVYVIDENSVAEKRLVKTGKQVDSEVQILSGLKEEEKVVVEGMISVSSGSKVKEVN